MEIYLDNSATTRVYPEVAEYMNKIFTEEYGNPSSMHIKGFDAEQILKKAKKQIADSLHAKESEIYFTSGGTESNNTAIFGTAKSRSRYGKHIITTMIEHPSVSNPMIELEKEGFEIDYLKPDSSGMITPSDVLEKIRPDTILVSIMMVNNEIGARLPVEEIGKILKNKAPNIYFHVDCVQGYGKYRINPEKNGIDLLSVSGHKIHGPKGIGFLYIREGIKIKPLLFGGGQQKDMRPGTENVPGIAGIGLAAELIYKDYDSKIEIMYSLKNYLADELSKLPDVIINSPFKSDGAPHIVSASFKDIRSEVLLHALEEKNIYVSSGSACASNHPGISGTLKAIGVKNDYINGTIRFSLSTYTTREDIDITLNVIKELLPVLRKFTRK